MTKPKLEPRLQRMEDKLDVIMEAAKINPNGLQKINPEIETTEKTETQKQENSTNDDSCNCSNVKEEMKKVGENLGKEE